MSDRTRILLAQGIGAAKAGDIDEAKFYLKWVLRSDASADEEIRAWRWLAELCNDPDEKRTYLELILVNDIGNAWARRQLAMMDGRLDPDDIINPDNLPAERWQPEKIRAERFVCADCGGRMEFASDVGVLICTYCGHRDVPAAADSDIPEEEFVVGLANAKGHRTPVTMQSFQCQGCGVEFLLNPETISHTCPYCTSSYTINVTESRTVIPPTGIIPHVVDEQRAHRLFREWLNRRGVRDPAGSTLPRGVYLPLWTFDIAGSLEYRYYEYDGVSQQYHHRTSRKPIFYDDVVVPACHTLSPELVDEVNRFDHDRLLPYNTRFLANWPAELYQISMADASIRARSHVVERERDAIVVRLRGRNENEVAISSRDVYVDAYKLIFVPLWLGHYRLGDEQYDVVINGQTGNVRGEGPNHTGRLIGILGRLFD